MRSQPALALVLAATIVLAVLPARAGDSEATLPLSEVLRLYRESEARGSEKPAGPPVGATVHGMELSGRLLERGLEVTASVDLSVLSSDAWVAVRLFRLDPRTHVTSLPTFEQGAFSVESGTLHFVTNRQGRYAFDVGLLVDAASSGNARSVEIAYDEAALALLRLRYDELLFDVAAAKGAGGEPGSLVIYPDRTEEGGRFRVSWEHTAAVALAHETQAATRPPIEPVIPMSRADVVSTLDGKSVVRMLYELRLEGRQPIELGLPDGYGLERAFLNGAALSAAAQDRTLSLEVAPARAGDDTARLELVLSGPPIRYLLSGRLEYAFPSVSWSVHELHVTLHLPQVFNYTWSAGSLGAAEQDAPAATYTLAMPTPGKAVLLHQELVSAAPWVRVAYTVDLEGHYFDGSAARAALCR